MSAPKISWKHCLALAVVALALGATAANAVSTITVPACTASTPNTDRFAGGCGAHVTFDGSATDAWVADFSPSGESEYRVRFMVNLSGLTTPGDFDNFVAYSGTDTNGTPPPGSSRFRITYGPAANGEENLFVSARLTNGTEVTSTPGILLKHGWHSIEVHWLRSAPAQSNGLVELWVDGVKKTAEMAGLAAIDNNSSNTGIDHGRWGAEGFDGATGSISMDAFASQRTGYIGPEAAFADVPTNHAFFKNIQGLYAGRITSGCGNNPLIFCPLDKTNRGSMAVLLMRTKFYYLDHLPAVPALVTQNIFADPEYDPAQCASTPSGCTLLFTEPYPEALYNAGITKGCGTNPLKFCPGNQIARAEMAVFILRMLNGSNYQPPPNTGQFQDDEFNPNTCANVPAVACSMLWMNDWAEVFFNLGLTTGCGDVNHFCPANRSVRLEIAAFLTRSALGIPLQELGP